MSGSRRGIEGPVVDSEAGRQPPRRAPTALEPVDARPVGVPRLKIEQPIVERRPNQLIESAGPAVESPEPAENHSSSSRWSVIKNIAPAQRRFCSPMRSFRIGQISVPIQRRS